MSTFGVLKAYLIKAVYLTLLNLEIKYKVKI